MDIKAGDQVKYLFPESSGSGKSFFVGIVDFVGESFVALRNEQNTVLRVSFKNFHLLERFEYLTTGSVPLSENYFG